MGAVGGEGEGGQAPHGEPLVPPGQVFLTETDLLVNQCHLSLRTSQPGRLHREEGRGSVRAGLYQQRTHLSVRAAFCHTDH